MVRCREHSPRCRFPSAKDPPRKRRVRARALASSLVHNTSERRRMERLNSKIDELYSILIVVIAVWC